MEGGCAKWITLGDGLIGRGEAPWLAHVDEEIWVDTVLSQELVPDRVKDGNREEVRCIGLDTCATGMLKGATGWDETEGT